MAATSERTFGLSAWSKVVLWFVVVAIGGSIGLLLYIIGSYIRSWKDLDSRVLFALPVLLLGWFGATQVRCLMTDGPLLRINSKGIEEHMSGFGFIPWDDIVEVAARTTYIRGGVYKTLNLRVRDARPYFKRVAWFFQPAIPLRWFRKDWLPVSFSYLDGKLDDALESIHAWRPDIPIEEISN